MHKKVAVMLIYKVFCDEPWAFHHFSHVLHGFEYFFAFSEGQFRVVAFLGTNFFVTCKGYDDVPQFCCLLQKSDVSVVNERCRHVDHDPGNYRYR